MRFFFIEGFLLYPPACFCLGISAYCCRLLSWIERKTVARNEMEGGYTGRQVIIHARLTEPQGKLKIHFLMLLTNTEKSRC